jgi:hypothetical protein
MVKINSGTAGRIYLIVLLLLAVMVSSYFEFGLAIVLLATQLYSTYKPPKAKSNLLLVVSSLIVLPLALEKLAGSLFAAIFMIPALLLLDFSLKEYADSQVQVFSRIGRSASSLIKTLTASLAAVFLVGLIVWSPPIMITVAIFFGYFTFSAAQTYRQIPKNPILTEKIISRLIVGETDSKQINLKSKTNALTHIYLNPVDLWVKIENPKIILQKRGIQPLNLRLTPPLAGPNSIKLQAAVSDCRGLIVTGQVLEPISLSIIPRAKFAQWLANKFLEQSTSGIGLTAAQSELRFLAAKHGVEFYGSRPYQSGDKLKEIDWKHSYMLGELITKEFTDAQGKNAVILADLTATDAEEADKLSYNFVMSALTLTIESIPYDLAVFNSQKVLAVTHEENPRVTLRRALELNEKISIIETKQRVLQHSDLQSLKRTIRQLGLADDNLAAHLGQLLKFEEDTNELTAKNHPSTLALNKATQNFKSPEVILVVSPLSGDIDALMWNLEKLKFTEYNVIMVQK